MDALNQQKIHLPDTAALHPSSVPQNDLVHDPSTNQPDNLNSILARERAEALVKNADVWASVDRIVDTEQANRAKDALDQLRAEWLRIENERKAEKKPHDDAALAVQKRYRPILAMIEACQATIEPLRTDWLRREDERLARERREAQARADAAAREAEEAARKAEQAKQAPVSARLAAAEAAERAKQAAEQAAAIPERARVQGSYGRPAASLREYWYGEVVDVLKAARHYRDRTELREVLTRLVSADARAGVRVAPPGCVIKSRRE
jgi:hypothetical protein